MTAKKTGAAHVRAFHPLFPVPADVDQSDLGDRDIHWIYIFRAGECANDKYKFDELTDEAEIAEKYGGGQFTLKARDEGRARWTASRELRLPGPPKPLFEAAPPPAPPVPVPVPAAGLALSEGASPLVRDVLTIAGILGPLFLQYSEAAARREEARTNMLMSLIANPNRGNDGMQAALLSAALQRNPSQEMVGMFQAGMNLGTASRGGEGADDMMGSIVEGLSQVVELEKLKNERKNQKPSAPKEGGT